MADTYAILGFSDTLDTPTVLHTSDSATDCDRWRDGYTRWGDWGGYDSLALYEVGPDQHPDAIHLHDAPIDTLDREDDDGRVICETCEGLADPDDISTTEEGQGFCSDCGDSDRIRWLHCDRQGEAWAFLA
jgi:hypothetical protein|tara:strand:+ start:530 stop:922 length:393 start_codon:yes stop_codon:yes gene_type:complete